MMTPMQTDLMNYSTPAAPTAHERQARRARRQARRITFLAFMEKVCSHVPRLRVATTRPTRPAPTQTLHVDQLHFHLCSNT